MKTYVRYFTYEHIYNISHLCLFDFSETNQQVYEILIQ